MDEQVRIIDPPRARTPTLVREQRGRQRHRGRYVALGLLALLIALLLLWRPWSGTGDVPAPGVHRQPAQPVRESTATVGDMPVTLQGIGTVTPLATVTVKTQINGQLTEVGFKEGQLVKKGDFLAQIDPRPYQVALEQAQGQLAHDQALLAQAQADLKRYQTLLRQDSISRQQAENQRFLVQQYQGSLQTDQANINSAKLNLAYCHIVSPTDGRVGLRQVDPGNYVQTSDPNGIVVITQLHPISVVFPLPQDDIQPVMARLADGAKLSVSAFDRGNTRAIATGTLETVDNQIDPTTGTVKLRATFANADSRLFPNEFVNSHLLVNTLSGVVLVPTAAVQTGVPGTYVWLVKPDSTVTVRPVKLGPSDGHNLAVLSGLAAGDKVVIDGIDRLREGMKVTTPRVGPPPSPPARAGGVPTRAAARP